MQPGKTNAHSRPCWTIKDGKVISEMSVTNLARRIGVSADSLTASRISNAGRAVFCFLGYEIHMGLYAPHVAPVVQCSRSDGPLLRRPVTHRLGVYRGGEW